LKLFEKFERDEAEFCTVDNDDCDGVYVDLIENPERFTDYSGPSSHKIWSAIYDQNCMIPGTTMLKQHSTNWNSCNERKLFYRIVSGNHL
jgi:ERO1-like protein beta